MKNAQTYQNVFAKVLVAKAALLNATTNFIYFCFAYYFCNKYYKKKKKRGHILVINWLLIYTK